MTVSVDRIDSSKGYVPGNVQLVCKWVNLAKQDYSNDDMEAVLREAFSAYQQYQQFLENHAHMLQYDKIDERCPDCGLRHEGRCGFREYKDPPHVKKPKPHPGVR
jgi:hypothetical protein